MHIKVWYLISFFFTMVQFAYIFIGGTFPVGSGPFVKKNYLLNHFSFEIEFQLNQRSMYGVWF